jgi:ribosomal-protein-alanine N-acetyltransferase
VPPEGPALRRCEMADLSQVSRVERASFPDHPYTKVDFVAYLLIAREGFMVASDRGSVVGYVIAISQGGEGSIQSIAVSPEARGKGIGEMLMRSAIDHLSGRAARVRLLVAAGNDAAIGLYRKLSFEETGKVVAKYYPDGDDALEMARELWRPG